MAAISRRDFFGNSAAAALLSACALELKANPLGLPIGCQTWPVQKLIAQDFPGHDQATCRGGIQDHRIVLAGWLCGVRIRRAG